MKLVKYYKSLSHNRFSVLNVGCPEMAASNDRSRDIFICDSQQGKSRDLGTVHKCLIIEIS
jgi:hypothetical protein